MLLLLLCVLSSDPAAIHSRGRVFLVHAEIDAEGTVPPGRVILLARPPGGDWAPVGDAAPGEPVRFAPKADGTYELSAIGVGIDGSREKPGRTPEAILVVDTVPPELRVSRGRKGPGPSVRILWEATDEHLSPEGVDVRLELGEVEASWKGGARGKVVLTPSGEGQRWTVRLVAVDLAGNRTEATVTYPEVPSAEPGVGIAAAGPDAGRSYAIGRSLLSRGMWVSSEIYLSRAVALAPRDSRAWNDLGVVLSWQGRRKEARGAFTRALALSPENPIPRWNRATTTPSEGGARLAARGISRLSSRRLGAWEGKPLETELAALTGAPRR